MDATIRCENCGQERSDTIESNTVDGLTSLVMAAWQDHICNVKHPNYLIEIRGNTYRAEWDSKDVKNLFIRLV